MYFLFGISLMFALLLILNFLIASAATLLWHFLAPSAEIWSAQKRAQAIFTLRIFPFAVAFIFVAALLIPAYLLFEPHSSGEIISLKLAALSLASAVGFLFAFYRIFGTWWKTRSLINNWLKNAEPIQLENVAIPVFCMNHSFPVIAVVGAFRPKMFVARQIFDSLNNEEIHAAVSHEYGHIVAYDNFKRILMRVCRDLLIFPFGRSLDRAWVETAETAADEYAAGQGNFTALNLASAIVKIAKIVPNNAIPTMPAGAFLLTEQSDFVNYRVRHLLDLTESKFNPIKYTVPGLGFGFFIFSLIALISIIFFANDYHLLEQAHILMENVVKILQ